MICALCEEDYFADDSSRQDLKLSGLHVFFSAGEYHQLQFTAESTILHTGINHVDVTCRVRVGFALIAIHH
jgi:hypothetical protein